METCFYFVCPTDCLENTINKTFKHKNYFYTSLGNSFNLESKTLHTIKSIINKHGINNLCIVLSLDNEIVLDALSPKSYPKTKHLNHFYNEVGIHYKTSKLLHKNNSPFVTLSYYLNKKIKELEFKLSQVNNTTLKIEAKVYNRQNNTFTNVLPSLLCLKKYHLN